MRKKLYKVLVYILLFNILILQSMTSFAQGSDTQVHTSSSEEVEAIDTTVEEEQYIDEEKDEESIEVLEEVSKDIEVKNALENEEEKLEVIEVPENNLMTLQATTMDMQAQSSEVHVKRTSYTSSLKQAIVEQLMKGSPQAWVAGGGWRNASVNEVTSFINPNNIVSGDLSKTLFTIEVNTGTLNVRQLPDTSSEVLTQVNRGQAYTVLSIKDGWYQISVGSHRGWVSGDLVRANINTRALQFLVLSEHVGIPAEELNKKLTNAGILKGHGANFLQASKEAKINEIYLIAHSLLETGNGASELAKGVLVSSVNGKAVEPKVVYNMFGIGARDSDPLKLGSERAYTEGWFTPKDAIIGGAKWIGQSYIHHPSYRQDTLYKMRWNPQTPVQHQYATDVNWANAQTTRLADLVTLAYSYNLDLKFDIPVYNPNMGQIPRGWVSHGNKTFYISNDGVIQTGWKFMNGSWYYLADTGVMATGWARDKGDWYYFNDKGQMQRYWTFVDGSWYYLNGSGVMQTGWFNSGGHRYFLNSGGSMRTGWLSNGGNWYYFNGSGIMQRGWTQVGNKRYFLNNNGVMQRGWLEQNNRLYFLASDGSMQTGIVEDGDTRYFLSPEGEIKTGWIRHEDNWYYANSRGEIQTGWLFRGSSWYYLNNKGVMQTGWLDEGGERYFLNSSGAMRRGWIEIEDNWYLLDGSGRMQTGWVWSNGYWYHLSENGKMSTGWLKDEGKWYFLNDNGAMYRGWLLDGGKWYYLNGSGVRQTGWITVDGVQYYLYPNGAKAVSTTIDGYVLCPEGTILYRELDTNPEPDEDTNTARTVIIDPGHGGSDPGAIGNGLEEKVINIQVAKKLESELKKLGYNVIMTRSTDVFLTLPQRTDFANTTNGEIFISIHGNSFGTSAPRGIETFHFATSSKGKDLATFIQNEVIKATGAGNRGVKTANFHVLRETRMPSALIEVGFISNPQDAANISNGTYQNKIVSGMVKGIELYFDKH